MCLIFRPIITNTQKMPSKKADHTYPNTAPTCYLKINHQQEENDHYFS
jgi:hypothetical protein